MDITWDDAAATAPLLADYLGWQRPDPQWFEGDGSAEGDGYYLQLVFTALQHAKTLGQPCPVFLHPKLCGVEGRQVMLELVDGTEHQVWVDRTGEWLPKHTIRQRSNGLNCTVVDPNTPIKNVRVISSYARVK